MTEKAYSDLQELRKIALGHPNPSAKFQSTWRREPSGAALGWFSFERELARSTVVA